MNAEAEMPIMPTEADRINARVGASLERALSDLPMAPTLPAERNGFDAETFRARVAEDQAELAAFAKVVAEHFGVPALATHNFAGVRVKSIWLEARALAHAYRDVR